MRGRIIKALSGFYYVETREGTYQCRARGIFKKDGVTPLVGDEVEIDILDEEDGVINVILPRKNEFIRPPISNIDYFLIMVAIHDPEPNFEIIDRFLVNAERADVNACVCINKTDIASESQEDINQIKGVYSSLYPVIFMSIKKEIGLDQIQEIIRDKYIAFAGPSGVGKTTLINRLGELNADTDEVSSKTGRGKHTTRHIEIYKIGSSHIYDTPGFTSFEAADIDVYELDQLFPEFREYIGKCKFDNCRHITEPDCEVKKALEKGKINESRYTSYVKMSEELINKEEWK